MNSSKAILLELLKLGRDQEEIALNQITTQKKASFQQISKIIHDLNEKLGGILHLNSDSVYIPQSNKMKLVHEAIQSGIPLEQIIETLHWREFESFCLYVLDYHDFSTTQNFHYSYHKKRWELDVIGLKSPLVLAIDAKKWKTGHAGALKLMVKNQIERVRAFSKSLYKREIRSKLGLFNWKKANIVPMLVTSKTYEIKIFKEVPIIPFFKLNKFLNDFHYYSDIILQYSIDFSSQKTLVCKKLTNFTTTS